MGNKEVNRSHLYETLYDHDLSEKDAVEIIDDIEKIFYNEEWFNNKETKPETKGHYLVIIEDGRYSILLWRDNKWWFDETQKEGLLFGIREDYVIKWMPLPSK